jgi:site-specific DNA-methyltransferase (adenine-specific)
MWKGICQAGEKFPRVHPTQKPEALMRWCLNLAPNAQVVFDPFMGSGTTLRAAKDLGRKAIGIEIEERYCEIAANRLRQEVLSFEATV